MPTHCVGPGNSKKRGLRFEGGSTIHRIREQDRQKGGGGRASALHLVDARLRVVLRGQPLGFHVLIGRLISVLFLSFALLLDGFFLRLLIGHGQPPGVGLDPCANGIHPADSPQSSRPRVRSASRRRRTPDRSAAPLAHRAPRPRTVSNRALPSPIPRGRRRTPLHRRGKGRPPAARLLPNGASAPRSYARGAPDVAHR